MFCVTDTPVIAWTISDDFLDHMWLIKSVPNEVDTYTIRNTVAGTFMDSGGKPFLMSKLVYCVRSIECDLGRTANGAQIVGYHQTNSDNQKWIIKKETSGTGFWKYAHSARS